jgi:hypothetical protein
MNATPIWLIVGLGIDHPETAPPGIIMILVLGGLALATLGVFAGVVIFATRRRECGSRRCFRLR